MLGLLVIYFLGKAFYDLADQHKKHKWGNAIAGVAIYYLGTFLAAILIGFGMEIKGVTTELNDFVLGLICLPFGLLSCWLFYRYKKQRFERKFAGMSDTLDNDILNDLN